MKEITEQFRQKIAEIVTNLNLDISDKLESYGRIWIKFTPSFPLWFQIEIDEDEDAAFIYAVARAHGINGDKSDYHDLLTAILAICLRLSDTASVLLTKLEMADILPGEIYSTRVIFDRQPPATFISLQKPDYDLITRILEESTLAAWVISQVWNILGEGIEEEKYLPPEDSAWVAQVGSYLKVKPDSQNVNCYSRKFPTWEYFRVINRDIFVIKFKASLINLPLVQNFKKSNVILDGVEGQIVTSSLIRNFISHKSLRTSARILKAFGQGLSDIVVVPTESHLYLLVKGGIIGIRSNGGIEAYIEEKARVLKRHQVEAKILLSSVQFEWNSSVDGDEFENLIVELLSREPGVIRARKIGQGNEPDFRRDILVEWYRPSTGESAFQLQRVVVQCKAHNRPVGKSKVSDITDLLRFHGSAGYLLVALSGVTKPLIDYLEKEDEKKEYWTDWWSRIEIEERMRANMDIVARYLHIVKIIKVK
jgi:hypothetical protein